MNPVLKDKLQNLPPLPGVYHYFDKKGKIIYVGKAKNLRSRVKSYFRDKVDSAKTAVLVSKIADLQLIVTDTEVEALVLENTLIKKYKPRYNVILKDDKTFPYIRITNEPYPQIFSTRDVIKDGSKYFGPYTNVKSMRASLRMINKTFQIRSCKYFIDDKSIAAKRIKVCLDYHIKKCGGPCEGLVSENEYNKMVVQVIKLLKGKTEELISELTMEMETASEGFLFEKAAELRDKINHLKIYSSSQKVVSSDFLDRDIIAAAVEERDVASTILIVRNGKLVGKKQFKLVNEGKDELPVIYSSLIKHYYSEYVEIPKELVLETNPDDEEALLTWLELKSNNKVKFTIPQRKSNLKSLVKMTKQNALLQLKEIQLQRMKREGNLPYVLSSLKRDLHLKQLPRKIECFDISHIQGADTVASMVVFVDGKPKKSLYRKFIIKTVKGVDDFASMREVITRRYSRVKKEKEKIADLIMVDGGKGQLSSAIISLNDIGYGNYEIIGLAKRLEEVFLPEHSEAQSIPKTSSSLKLLQHVRDEAHRFAITFHRQRRSKRTITTELLKIKGIGQNTAEQLLKKFKSVKAIKKLSEMELAKVIGKSKAALVTNHFNVNVRKNKANSKSVTKFK